MSDRDEYPDPPFPVTGTVPIIQPDNDELYEFDSSTREPKDAGPRGLLWLFIVLAGGIFAALTAPGQTAGLSIFTDPLIAEIGVDRTEISFSYLIATLVGAATMPLFGRALDKFGARLAIIWIGLALAGVLFAASFVTEILGLTGAYVGLRMFGQGALTLASTTLVARLVTHRSGLALGISGAMGAAGISFAPVGIERLITLTDIATAWRIEAAIVVIIALPLALLLPQDRPTTHTETGSLIVNVPEAGYTQGQAVKTLMFWAFTSAGFTVGMMSTGLAFHLISILGAQGLTSLEAASNFIPQTIAALLMTLGFGAIVDKIDPRWGLIASMLSMGGAMILLPFVQPGWWGIVFGLLLGSAQGALRGVEAAGFVRYFDRGHIGSIRGLSTGVTLASTSLGPLYFALGLDWSGSYLAPSLWGALLPAAVIVLALVAKEPPALAETEAVSNK
jgi:MFS family permease